MTYPANSGALSQPLLLEHIENSVPSRETDLIVRTEHRVVISRTERIGDLIGCYEPARLKPLAAAAA